MPKMSNFSVTFDAMGCTVQAWLSAADARAAQPLTALAGWFEVWEAAFSRFRPTSELRQLNVRAGQWTPVSRAMYEVIGLAVRAAAETDGLFNPLVLDALEAAGYDHSFEPDRFVPGQLRSAPPIPDARRIELDAAGRAIRLPPGARLDLGGIAKGWAVQQAAERLAGSGSGACLVDAGGDMAAFGSPDGGGGWRVALENPLSGARVCTIRLLDAAVATSGSDYRRWQRDGQPLHHLIDPRTGLPAQGGALTATVIAPDAVQAETWAKSALISGALTDFPTLIVHSDGSTESNSQFEAFIHHGNHV